MSDEVITCIQCGRSFVWSYSDQRSYKERKLETPRRCKACRIEHNHEIAERERVRGTQKQPKMFNDLPKTRKWFPMVFVFAMIGIAIILAIYLLLS
ncbi:MAG: zinc-ribbon domain containing protein [Caldilineaceae bacterium]|nr:zinc-ribbon domain containing protein [Caldilineaceae bacterium]MBP8108896.1 zinc-ribbon domain containing protein [Caldilineaceae bacterium]MBP8122919.1 zinc-ribbon domain containing protein [Caldilineaceae bacterium]MBP9073043.1 zinc-ribbon domain containing protein [Caldilineaceae bacterium]